MVRWIIPGIFLLAVAGIVVWAWNFNAPERTVEARLPASVVAPIPYDVVGDRGPYTIEGTAIMDTSTGEQAVPFIMYTDEKGRIRTKQLIYADMRGCLPNAGDIPCVPTYPQESAYPELSTGMPITATGYIREDRFLLMGLRVGG